MFHVLFPAICAAALHPLHYFLFFLRIILCEVSALYALYFILNCSLCFLFLLLFFINTYHHHHQHCQRLMSTSLPCLYTCIYNSKNWINEFSATAIVAFRKWDSFGMRRHNTHTYWNGAWKRENNYTAKNTLWECPISQKGASPVIIPSKLNQWNEPNR